MSLIALALASAVPVQPKPEPMILGWGNVSCGDWLETRAGAAQPFTLENASIHWTEAGYVSWVQGFLSGLSTEGPPREPPGLASIEAWLDNHCRAHPLDDLWRSTLDLDFDLLRRHRGLPEKG